VIVVSLRTPRSAGENFGCTWQHLGARTTSLGSLGSANNLSGSANDNPGSTWELLRYGWEYLESRKSRLGKTTSSLRMLQVPLEIIATTDCSTIFRTDVVSVYSHL